MKDLEVAEYAIAKLDLRPDDTLVVKCQGTLESERSSRVHGIFRRLVPDGVRVVILDDRTDLQVLRAEPPPTPANAPSLGGFV